MKRSVAVAQLIDIFATELAELIEQETLAKFRLALGVAELTPVQGVGTTPRKKPHKKQACSSG